MADTFKFELVTPTRVLLEDEILETVLPGTEGELGVMAGHDPLMTGLATGIVSVRSPGGTDRFFVSEGYVEITGDRVLMLAEVAEHAKEIDTERALAAKERAQERLKPPLADDLDALRAEMALKRALYRLQLAEKS